MIKRIEAKLGLSFTLFFKWGAVAGSTFVIDLVLFALLLRILDSLVLINFISFAASTVFNFFAHKLWTFKSYNYSSSEVKRYLLSLLMSITGNTLILLLLSWHFSVPASKLSANLAMIPINFILMSRFTFRS